jgi:hypothetical protein
MLDAAKTYYRALDAHLPVAAKQKAALKRRLNKLARPYADNPAYQALLELERVKAFKE